MIRGMVTQEGEDWDNIFSENVVNKLFQGDDPNKVSLDLVALNIQRGRDHGLPGYTAYREEIGRPKPKSFDELDQIQPKFREILKNLYKDVDDIDLFAGEFSLLPPIKFTSSNNFFVKLAGILENKQSDEVITGPTFSAIISDTFYRLKLGDRFFYDLGPDNLGTKRFTLSQLNEIRKASIARILCDNSGLDEVQPQAFKKAGITGRNKKVSCDTSEAIPIVNMSVFQE